MRRVSSFTKKAKLSACFRSQHTAAAAAAATPAPFLPCSSQAFDTYISLLRRCAAERSVERTRRVHLHMKKSGFAHLSLSNKLVDAYLKCGAVDDAREVFDAMPKPHIVFWNAMISAYVRCMRSREAITLYKKMLSERMVPDEFTFSSILRAFADLGLVSEGCGAHGQLLVLGLDAANAFVGSALVDMYAKFGRLREARIVYNSVHDKDVVLATALVVGYTQNGADKDAIRLFRDMIKDGIRPDDYTFASVLIACGNIGDFRKGILIHGLMLKFGLELECSSQTSLLTMYSKCGMIDDAVKVFERVKDPNEVTWTAIIGCLVCNNREELALSMLRDMIHASLGLNEFTLSTALRACSSLALFEQGKMIHAFSTKVGLDKDCFVGAALVDAYGKCGRVGMAEVIFDHLPRLDLVSINSMINAYAQSGQGFEAIRLFETMQNSGLEPNDATFTSILSACSNAGLLKEGRRVFSFITNNYRHGPSIDHYACMVDLLGRAGELEEAEELVTQVKNPDKVLWRALLSACKIHRRMDVAERVARNVLELDPGDDGTFILLSNTYASLGQWEEVIRIKSTMRKMKLKKDPAISWIEVDRQVNAFIAGDKDHPEAEEIYKELEELITRTKELGYVPDTSCVLQQMDDVEKERSLYYHSEKLAVAFGILCSSGKGNTSITIFKNLRVCGDCHSWMKLVSLVVGKDIIARDAKRFHHFKNGLCSCNDYW